MEMPKPEASPSNSVLSRFIAANGSMIADIKRKLRSRDYENISAKSVKSFLEAAARVLDDYNVTTDLFVKTAFLKALVRAWEIADATNRFNTTSLGENYKDIRRFSRKRYDEILTWPLCDLGRTEKDYYKEVARSSLIGIAEECRTSDSRFCRERLTELVRFVSTRLRESVEYPCDGTLAQFYYYLAKVERMEGDLFKAEKSIGRASHLYLNKARTLSERNEEKEAEGRPDEENETEEKILEVKLRAGVVEVARAWLYFSQRRYDSAKHTAGMALIILSQSSDWLSQANARLVVAAVDRVTADTIGDLNMVIKNLEDLRTLFEQRHHFRLQARTEHELVLTLILLDGMFEESANVREKVKSQDPLARAEQILEQGPLAQRKTGRWAALFFAQKSRVLRRRVARNLPVERDFTEALNVANQGLETAIRSEARDARIETLIARGEVLFQQGVGSHLAKQEAEDKGQSARGPTMARREANQSRDTSLSLFIGTDQMPTRIDLTNSKQCFDRAREDFTQALKWLFRQSSQGGYAELSAICHLYLARIAIRSSQFGLDEFSDAEYQLYEFQRLGQFEHAWLRRLEAKVRAELERRDEWALIINSTTYEDADIELKQFMIKRIERTNPGIHQKEIAKILGVDRQTLRNWKELIRDFPKKGGGKSS